MADLRLFTKKISKSERAKKTARVFTLIELMIVVAVISILAAIVMPKFSNMLRKSKEASTKGSLGALRTALVIYASDNEDLHPCERWRGPGAAPFFLDYYGKALIGAMVPKYVESIPTIKLGDYHPDSTAVFFLIEPTDFDGNRSSSVVFISLLNIDELAWDYTSVAGSSFWVNCWHTDTKNVNITGW